MPRLTSGIAVAFVLAAGCSSSDESSANTTPLSSSTSMVTATSAEPAETTAPATTAAPSIADTPAIAALRRDVEMLASDEMKGRNNSTAESVLAQDYLIAQLKGFAGPLVAGATGDDAYRQKFPSGANLLAVIPGSDLADQYVIVGAHYDHVGYSDQPGNYCDGGSSSDLICNGATDNATGVAAALAIGRSIAADNSPPRRSVIIALWDAEEDGLLGSKAYLANPLVPIGSTIAYVNFDIQGANISPAIRNSTVMVGAETGGPNLIAAAVKAASASSLDTVAFSLLFGQGRSDHANFVAAGVPSVFFTDATPPCYHTVGDDASIVDYPKLEQQVVTAEGLTRDLMSTDVVPVYDPLAPPATFADAASMLSIITRAQADFGRFSAQEQAASDQFVTDLQAIVDAGAANFDDTDVGTLLSGALGIVTAWESGTCDGFLDATG
ncbi:MAG: M20/M25/M40 family metallo-hydrolase [Actinobacteria bacterium]|nr:M20/M25/M40 family metallo-hydrolase [Actinomycetota bacterium]